MLMDINYYRCNECQTIKLNSLPNFPTIWYMLHCIPVCGRIKETARVDNLYSYPPSTGWITSYPPVVNGYVIQTLNTKLKAWR